jgi:D-alanyl-lipoteichoic acid acyltransferase DltB (MBOAT superfamily)
LVVRNIMLTMVLGGLWHGANWTFVIWGALHGTGQAVGHLRRKSRVSRGLPGVAEGTLRSTWQRFWTFQFVCLGWVFFNASSFSNATAMLGRLFTGWGNASPLITPLLIITIIGVIEVQFLPANMLERAQRFFSEQRAFVQAGLLGVVLLAITTLGPTGVAPFIYYRF